MYQGILQTKSMLKYLEWTVPNLSVAFITLQYVEARGVLTTSAHRGKPSTTKQCSKKYSSHSSAYKESGASPTFTQEELRRKAAEVAWPAEHIHRIFAFLSPRCLWHFRKQLNFSYKPESTVHRAGTGQAHVTGPLKWQSLHSVPGQLLRRVLEKPGIKAAKPPSKTYILIISLQLPDSSRIHHHLSSTLLKSSRVS